MQFPTVFNRHSAHEDQEQTFVATVKNTSTSNLEKATETLEKKVSAKAEKFAKYIQKKTEKEAKTTSPSGRDRDTSSRNLKKIFHFQIPVLVN